MVPALFCSKKNYLIFTSILVQLSFGMYEFFTYVYTQRLCTYLYTHLFYIEIKNFVIICVIQIYDLSGHSSYLHNLPNTTNFHTILILLEYHEYKYWKITFIEVKNASLYSFLYYICIRRHQKK